MTTTTDTLPVFYCRGKWSRWRQMWELVGKCPYCNRTHRHGGGTGKKPEFTDPDSRLSHCWSYGDKSEKYRIEEIK